MISYVSEEKERDFISFMSKRISRFYSVVVPVVFFLVSMYYVTSAISPEIYQEHGKGSMNHGAVKLFGSLSFLSYNAFFIANLPGADPFWSLVCEWWYYVVYALAVYCNQRLFSLLLIGFIAAVSSPIVLFLFPVWLLGVVVRKLYIRQFSDKRPAVSLCLCMASVVGMLLLWKSGLRYSLMNTEVLFGKSYSVATYFPYYWVFGCLVSVHLYSVMVLLESWDQRVDWSGRVGCWFSHATKKVAGASFFMYLTHIPIMLFLKASIGDEVLFVILCITVVVCLVVGGWVEDLRFIVHRYVFYGLNVVAGWLRRRPLIAELLRMELLSK